MKAILMIEMPKACMECPLEMDLADTSGEKWKGNICRGCGSRNVDQCEKPDWCPLVPLKTPTAYDVDKVVEQICELSENEFTLAKVIHIVKAGGIDE